MARIECNDGYRFRAWKDNQRPTFRLVSDKLPRDTRCWEYLKIVPDDRNATVTGEIWAGTA